VLVKPSTALFSGGTNLQQAITSLTQYLSTNTFNIPIEPTDALAYFEVDGHTIVAREKEKWGFIVATKIGSEYLLAARLTLENKNLIATNLLTKRTLDLGDATQYFNQNRTQTLEQLTALRKKLFPLLTLDGLEYRASVSSSSNRATTQGYNECFADPPPMCVACKQLLSDYYDAECTIMMPVTVGIGTLVAGVIGGAYAGSVTGGAGGTVVAPGPGTLIGVVGGAIVGASIGALVEVVHSKGATRKRNSLYKDYVECRRKPANDCLTTGQK
jgi:hypothetical protein